MIYLGLIISIVLLIIVLTRKNREKTGNSTFKDKLRKIAKPLGLQVAGSSAHPFINGYYRNWPVELRFYPRQADHPGKTEVKAKVWNKADLEFGFTRVGSMGLSPAQGEVPDPNELIHERVTFSEPGGEDFHQLRTPEICAEIIKRMEEGMRLRLEGEYLILEKDTAVADILDLKGYLEVLRLLSISIQEFSTRIPPAGLKKQQDKGSDATF